MPPSGAPGLRLLALAGGTLSTQRARSARARQSLSLSDIKFKLCVTAAGVIAGQPRAGGPGVPARTRTRTVYHYPECPRRLVTVTQNLPPEAARSPTAPGSKVPVPQRRAAAATAGDHAPTRSQHRRTLTGRRPLNPTPGSRSPGDFHLPRAYMATVTVTNLPLTVLHRNRDSLISGK